MAQDKRPIDVGHEITALLQDWRPEMDADAVTDAIMHALERYSINLEGGSETGMRSCLFRLRDKIDQRIRSL